MILRGDAVAVSTQPFIIQTDRLLDGLGKAAVAAELLVVEGHIQAIGPLGSLDTPAGTQRWDASGLVVCPGFIDLHTHSDVALLQDGRGESQVRQGVTLEVVGNCGHSAAPMPVARDRRHGLTLGPQLEVEPCWRDFEGFLDALDAARPTLNIAALVGHGTLRQCCLPDPQVPVPDARGQLALEAALIDALDAGAIGLSSGLEYNPGANARIDELASLCKHVGRYGGLYTTHVRNRDRQFQAGLDEALRTAKEGHVKLQISHMTPKYGAPSGAAGRMIESIEQARASDLDVAFDVIPHQWGPTTMAAILPGWSLAGGIQETLALLRDPQARQRIQVAPNPIWPLVTEGRWDDIVLFGYPPDRALEGRSIATLALERGQSAFSCVLDLLFEAGEALHSVTWVGRNFSEADTRSLLQQPFAGVISDAITQGHDGPLASLRWSPSAFGWVARFLGWCRTGAVPLCLPEAIRRLTSLPAQRLGLDDRGALKPGAVADLVVFDPEAVADHSTLQQPTLAPSGFLHVWVNGVQVLREAKITGRRPGRTVRATGRRVYL